jgi:hypothetical protein
MLLDPKGTKNIWDEMKKKTPINKERECEYETSFSFLAKDMKHLKG